MSSEEELVETGGMTENASDSSALQVDAGDWELKALTPKYESGAHSVYVNAIRAALQDDEILNIALSGNYGVGKSSIVRGLLADESLSERIVVLSLSTLAPIEVKTLDESVPKQAVTPTNRIQQEIVKQLLYREVPGRLPGSRFARIERFNWLRELGIAGMIGFVIAIVFLLTGWATQIATVFKPLVDIGLWVYPLILAIAMAGVYCFRVLFYGRINIKQLSAGAATVTLDDRSVSYFDQYLDEIVHFFEVSRAHNIVIFEDIDRFNNSHIFETLRSLNTLLNSAPQINERICFIYAIKDSIFDKIGLEKDENRVLDQSITEADDPAVAETVRANRTKFFDLVIPVVPFITHRNARSLANKLLDGVKHDVNPELFDLASQYVPDMRLLINVRNEFLIFRDRIFSGDGKKLKLTQTNLFAMMLYKSTHLTDFEDIRRGKSRLDTLYHVSRELVRSNRQRLESSRRSLQSRLSRINGAALRAERLGQSLLAHIARTAEAANIQLYEATYSVGSELYTEEELKQAEFWATFASAKEVPVTLDVQSRYGSLTFSRKSLASALRDPIDVEAWETSAREELRAEINETTEEIKFLRGADMGALIKRPEFLVEYEEEAQSLESVAYTLFKEGLAFQLVRAGYLDRDFTLYTSVFQGGRVSAASTNFIMLHVERDLTDVDFELSPNDVDIVVRERGENSLKEPALYNVDILNHLLKTDVDTADIMIKSLVSLGEPQKQFIQAYLESGTYQRKLVERFTPHSSRALIYLVSEVEVNDSLRLDLVDAVLLNLGTETKYRTDEAADTFLLERHSELSSFTSDSVPALRARQIAELFDSVGEVLPDLEVLGETVRSTFIQRSLYEITLANLTIALGSDTSLALDSISAANEVIYNYCLENLTEYLQAIEGHFSTIDTADSFIRVIEDVIRVADSEELELVVSGAANVCIVTSLSEVEQEAWPVLAKHHRFPVTLANVLQYIESVGAIDVNLGELLSERRRIVEASSAGEDVKEALAYALIDATQFLPAPDTRAQLVESLGLKSFLNVDDIPAEKGDLFANLRWRNVIADDEESYARLSSTDWPTREAFIARSKKFWEYVTPQLVQNDLSVLLLSDKVDDKTKRVIVSRADEFIDGAGTRDLSQLARHAIQTKSSVSEGVVVAMASGGVPSQYVVQLLVEHLGSISRDDLFAILESLGRDYAKLTAVGFDRPKLQNTPANDALLKRLKLEGIVKSYDSTSSMIKVYKRQKAVL